MTEQVYFVIGQQEKENDGCHGGEEAREYWDFLPLDLPY
jgi:hypothetical protein